MGYARRKFDDGDKALIREIYRRFLEAKRERMEVEMQILELMDKRESLLATEAHTCAAEIAAKFSCHPTTVRYLVLA